MLSGNEIKHIRSLELKKYRDAESLFVAEGPKMVEEMLDAFPLRRLIVEEGKTFAAAPRGTKVEYVSPAVMQRLSFLKTPHDVIAVFAKPAPGEGGSLAGVAERELCLALDDIQNPGNLGTIIRTASWMGVRHVFCSPSTADVYSPKVLQATMGALGTVRVSYCDLPDALSRCKADVWGTFLDGENIYTSTLSSTGVIVIGNEGGGISREVERTVTRRLFIPPYPPEGRHVESLNAGMATAITLAAFRSRYYRPIR